VCYFKNGWLKCRPVSSLRRNHMFYPSPVDPHLKTLFGAQNKFKRGCEEAAVTTLSCISNIYNNNGKEVGSARRGAPLYLAVGEWPVGTAVDANLWKGSGTRVTQSGIQKWCMIEMAQEYILFLLSVYYYLEFKILWRAVATQWTAFYWCHIHGNEYRKSSDDTQRLGEVLLPRQRYVPISVSTVTNPE
jgi:hypothetical protein